MGKYSFIWRKFKEICIHLIEVGPQRENPRSVHKEELDLKPVMHHFHQLLMIAAQRSSILPLLSPRTFLQTSDPLEPLLFLVWVKFFHVCWRLLEPENISICGFFVKYLYILASSARFKIITFRWQQSLKKKNNNTFLVGLCNTQYVTQYWRPAVMSLNLVTVFSSC